MFGQILVKYFTKLSAIFFGSTTVIFTFFNEVCTKLFLFLSGAIDFISCQIFEELDLYCSQ